MAKQRSWIDDIESIIFPPAVTKTKADNTASAWAVNSDTITFSTGKTVYANNAIIGLCISDNEDKVNKIFYGYDGALALQESDYDYPSNDLTSAECVELADKLIQQWTAFKLIHQNRTTL
jgi:hypothetical protein